MIREKEFFKVREKSGNFILSQGNWHWKKSGTITTSFSGSLILPPPGEKSFITADLAPSKVGEYIRGHCNFIDIFTLWRRRFIENLSFLLYEWKHGGLFVPARSRYCPSSFLFDCNSRMRIPWSSEKLARYESVQKRLALLCLNFCRHFPCRS